MTIEDFRDTESGKCLICALGQSYEHQTHLLPSDNVIPRIGCNDASILGFTRYSVLVDNINTTRNAAKELPNRVAGLMGINSWTLFTVRQTYIYFINESAGMNVVYVALDEESHDPTKSQLEGRLLCQAGTVVFPAISLAMILGFRDIGIIGFDYSGYLFRNPGKLHGQMSGGNLVKNIKNCNDAAVRFLKYATEKEIRIVNLNPNSAINGFPKMQLEKWL